VKYKVPVPIEKLNLYGAINDLAKASDKMPGSLRDLITRNLYISANILPDCLKSPNKGLFRDYNP
jgi:hypothetical protein